MKQCEQCNKTFKSEDKCFTAVGVDICEDCNTKNDGTISMDLIFDKITKKI